MILIQVLGAFIAVMALAVIYGVPKRYVFYSGIVGAAGWLVYLLGRTQELTVVPSMFLASTAVTLMSNSFARILKTPVTLFLIAGILPLVPGVGMYRIVYHIIINDYTKAIFYFSETMQIAGVIALTIFIVDTIFRVFQRN